VPTESDVPGEEVYPTQPIPFNARHVAQSAFCATYPPGIEDPKLLPLARPIFTPPSVKAPILVSPGATGGPNRGSGSFSPRTNLLYVTGKNDAMLLQAKSVTEPIKPGLGAPGHFQSFTEWKMGTVKATQSIAAYDPNTGDLAWVTEVPGITSGGNIATAGDLVFEAVGNKFYALDAKTGKVVADVTMKISAFSSPLAFMAGGKQFVAIASGNSIVAIGLP
jgi:outer membrane protein assembly factor BamB